MGIAPSMIGSIKWDPGGGREKPLSKVVCARWVVFLQRSGSCPYHRDKLGGHWELCGGPGSPAGIWPAGPPLLQAPLPCSVIHHHGDKWQQWCLLGRGTPCLLSALPFVPCRNIPWAPRVKTLLIQVLLQGPWVGEEFWDRGYYPEP